MSISKPSITNIDLVKKTSEGLLNIVREIHAAFDDKNNDMSEEQKTFWIEVGTAFAQQSVIYSNLGCDLVEVVKADLIVPYKKNNANLN